MKSLPILAFGLTVSVVMSGLPDMAKADTAPTKSNPMQGKVADKDFGRLSADGVSAFNDVHLARMAIFDGKTNMAAKLVADALASLQKAKTDNTAFIKAETALHSSGPSAPDAQTHQTASATPIAWIPIDGEVVLDEDYQATPEKAAAVVNANKSLEKGEGDKAMEAIRLAAVEVNYTVAVAPLEQSIADITQANQLITSHDYFGASQALRKAESGIRYDEMDDVANIKGGDKKVSGKSK